ncbi:MAG: ATP-binding protein [Alphaproteobacteria bacterium]|nr:ATP-binding protein [Alphaproteobacteria bacterium]
MNQTPPKIYILCGFIASGKTTYAAQIEAEIGAIRFNLDEWMLPLFGEHLPRAEFDEKLLVLTDKFKDMAEKLLVQNVSVILDFGFWKKQQRDEIRVWAQGLNVKLQLVHFNVDAEISKGRAIARRSDSAYAMDDEMYDSLYNMYEPPADDEVFDVVVTA